MAVTQLKGRQVAPLPLDATSGEVSGILPIANGGTGRSTESADYLQLTPTATPPAHQAGRLFADSTNDSLTYFNSDSGLALQVGQEQWIRARNVTGANIPNGTPVYIVGQDSGLPSIAPARANTMPTSLAVGITTQTIATGANGVVTTEGLVRNINTSAFTAGAILYVSSDTAGAMVTTIPAHPNFRIRIGIVVVSNATTGSILVTPTTSMPATNITIGTTAPASPLLNDLWVDTN